MSPNPHVSPAPLAAALAALLGAAAPAQAAVLQLDFTGVITVSQDVQGPGETVGRLFGKEFFLTATPGQGQVGEVITGRIYIDDSIYPDTAPQANIGAYGGAGNPSGPTTPGTSNAFRTTFTIAGKTFDSNWFQDVIGAPYSSEAVTLYDPTGVQDYFVLTEQEAYKPLYNQGAYGQILVGLNLLSVQSVQNFLNGTSLDQLISLGSADLANFQNRTGSYEISLYCGWAGSLGITTDGNCPAANAPFGAVLDEFNRYAGPASGSLGAAMLRATGEFTLTSLSLQPAPAVVPVPAAAWLLGSGLAGLAGFARRRARG
ncbi:MAG: VPLPA-CTERM sorting domain-containing protein [Chromatiales bacterium]|nr:VPLPA-CTERM sorting domain-containing protein [Chromatiales bacterium]